MREAEPSRHRSLRLVCRIAPIRRPSLSEPGPFVGRGYADPVALGKTIGFPNSVCALRGSADPIGASGHPALIRGASPRRSAIRPGGGASPVIRVNCRSTCASRTSRPSTTRTPFAWADSTRGVGTWA